MFPHLKKSHSKGLFLLKVRCLEMNGMFDEYDIHIYFSYISVTSDLIGSRVSRAFKLLLFLLMAVDKPT